MYYQVKTNNTVFNLHVTILFVAKLLMKNAK